MAKVGDIVRFLNSVGGGRVVRIEGRVAYVDDDGFETPVLQNELVVVSAAESRIAKVAEAEAKANNQAQVSQTAHPPRQPMPEYRYDESHVEEPIVETPYGDKLNIVLAFEPRNIKELSTTEFDAVIVNDSNYWLSLSYLTSPTGQEWTLASQVEIAPNTIEPVDEVSRQRLSEMTWVAVQFTAYKKGKPFETKLPVLTEQKLDMTKFFKLHCFRPNIYFDNPVLAVDIMVDDKLHREPKIDPRALQQAIKQKGDNKATRRAVRRSDLPDKNAPLVVDLHINQLLDDTRGMSTADILNYQIDQFRKVMEENLRNRGRRIIFIHGKGEGVLRQALLKELNYRYKGHSVQDASFKEYGYGATQVTIK